MAGIDDKYIKIQGWMATQLELYGNDLIIYAYIYSFQFKDILGKEVPTEELKAKEIPLRDFVEWTKQSERNVRRILQKLEDRRLIKITSSPGKTSSYSVFSDKVNKAIKRELTPDKMSRVDENVRGDKMSGVPGQNVQGSVDKMSRVPRTKPTKTPDKMSGHLQHNYIDNRETTSTTPRAAREDASASLSSTDTEDRYEDLSKSEIAFFEKQALKKLNETDETTGQKLYLTKDPRDQFPKAFLFMTAKDTSQFTDTEFELFKMVSMYTAFGPAKPLPAVSEEDAKYVPPASEIGQEAHDAQQALVDWLFEGGPSPSSYAHDALLQSSRSRKNY